MGKIEHQLPRRHLWQQNQVHRRKKKAVKTKNASLQLPLLVKSKNITVNETELDPTVGNYIKPNNQEKKLNNIRQKATNKILILENEFKLLFYHNYEINNLWVNSNVEEKSKTMKYKIKSCPKRLQDQVVGKLNHLIGNGSQKSNRNNGKLFREPNGNNLKAREISSNCFGLTKN